MKKKTSNQFKDRWDRAWGYAVSRVSTCYSSAMFSILKKKIKTFLFFRGHGNESCGLITISSLKIVQSKEDLALITALNQSGSFGKNVVKF